MAAALRSLQKLSSLGVAAAAATTLSYSGNKPSACDQRRRFEGKTIVITGGGGTFGRVGARYFAEQGAKVVLVDVNQAALDSVANDVTGITTCACDVRDPNQVQSVIDACGRIDLLWNNAGYQGAMKPLLEYPADDVQAVMDINVVGAFRVLQACARNMAAHGGGAIVQTGSVAGLRGTPTMGAYVASKAAIHGLTMTASKDLAPHKIRVNTVMPALIGPEEGYMRDAASLERVDGVEGERHRRDSPVHRRAQVEAPERAPRGFRFSLLRPGRVGRRHEEDRGRAPEAPRRGRGGRGSGRVPAERRVGVHHGHVAGRRGGDGVV